MKLNSTVGGLFVMSVLLGILVSTDGRAGAGGAGNTSDFSIQFSFAKSTAAGILESVSPVALFQVSGRKSLSDFYDSCRRQMYIGALRTRFELVDTISDGGEYHALAQRLPGAVIRISRKEMEKQAEMRQLTAPFLTALMLHEVGHDCQAPGITADDSADALLNDLAEALLKASSSRALVHLIDLEFIEGVGRGEPRRWTDLSSRVRGEIASRTADYVGDWIYLKNRSIFSERPAPGSQFFTSQATSLIPGWGNSLPLAAGEQLKGVVDQLLAASYRTRDFSYIREDRVHPLPVELGCAPAVDSVTCRASVKWDATSLDSLRGMGPEIEFSLDIFGELKITKIRVRE